MDKKYIDLFKELARATAISAEQVMDYDKAQEDEKGFETAKVMRDDYEALHDRLTEDYKMNKADAAKLLVGVMIQLNHLQDKITAIRKATTGYQTDIIPKLQDIVDNTETDEEVAKMADEKFIIENNE
jgi:hypothetical protein